VNDVQAWLDEQPRVKGRGCVTSTIVVIRAAALRAAAPARLGEAAIQVRSKMTTGSGMLRSPATQNRTARGVTPRRLAAFVWFIPRRFRAARSA